MGSNMQKTGNKKPIGKSTLTEFLAAPFMFLAGLNLWISAYITGNHLILMQIEEENDDNEEI